MLEPRDVERYERELRAMLRRAGDEDPEGVATIVQLIDSAHRELPAAVELSRTQHGWSWADIGTALGITRQAAHNRFRLDYLDHHPDTHVRSGVLKGSILRHVRARGYTRKGQVAS